jgi:hypothetical protein
MPRIASGLVLGCGHLDAVIEDLDLPLEPVGAKLRAHAVGRECRAFNRPLSIGTRLQVFAEPFIFGYLILAPAAIIRETVRAPHW